MLAVDAATVKFVAALQVEVGKGLARVSWTNPFETAALLAGVEVLADAGGLEVVMETSGVYGDAQRWQLRQRGIAACRVEAKRVHDSAAVYDGVPSLRHAKTAS